MGELAGRTIRGIVFDLDGTLYDDRGPFPGAMDTVCFLHGLGVRVCYATHTTRLPSSTVVDRLLSMGFPSTHVIVTAPLAAVSWLRRRGKKSVALYLAAPTAVEFADFVREDFAPDAVIVGDLGPEWTFDRLDAAFRQLMNGADLVAVQRNRYWKTASGLTLDAGPFVAALEYAAATKATVVGKPAAAFFEAALGLLDLPLSEVLMVGDDVASDVGGAIEAGLGGVLVRTGKYRPEDLGHGVAPDAVVDSVADLPALLGLKP